MPERDAIDELVDWQMQRSCPTGTRICRACGHVWTSPFGAYCRDCGAKQ